VLELRVWIVEQPRLDAQHLPMAKFLASDVLDMARIVFLKSTGEVVNQEEREWVHFVAERGPILILLFLFSPLTEIVIITPVVVVEEAVINHSHLTITTSKTRE
jgi:hypothetical protein